MNQSVTKPESNGHVSVPVQSPNATRQAGSDAAVRYRTPLANVTETPDGFTLETELPGVSRAGLEIHVSNGELQVVGHRSAPAGTYGEPVYRESRGRDYRRTFELDPSIDVSAITAQLEQGVLRLHLPKAESSKPRKIEVSV